MTTILIQLLVFAAIAAIVLWALSKFNLPQPVHVVVIAIIAIIAILLVVRLLGIPAL